MYSQLAAIVLEANLELARTGLAILTWGNVSMVDREGDVVAIKPSGVPYKDMKAEDIAIVRLSTGERVAGLKPSSDTPTHLCLYRAFGEIGGVAHSHSTCATAFAQAGLPIPCLGTTHADSFLGEIPITGFIADERIAGDYEYETGNVIVEAFRGREPMHTPAALVRAHGPFTWGKDADDAVINARILEEVARMAMYTYALNPGLDVSDRMLFHKHHERKHGAGAYYGQGSAPLRTAAPV